MCDMNFIYNSVDVMFTKIKQNNANSYQLQIAPDSPNLVRLPGLLLFEPLDFCWIFFLVLFLCVL